MSFLVSYCREKLTLPFKAKGAVQLVPALCMESPYQQLDTVFFWGVSVITEYETVSR